VLLVLTVFLELGVHKEMLEQVDFQVNNNNGKTDTVKTRQYQKLHTFEHNIFSTAKHLWKEKCIYIFKF